MDSIFSTKEYFTALEISTMVSCKINCDFCPQKLYVSSYKNLVKSEIKIMNTSNFKIILNNLRNSLVEKLTFSGYTENFLNPDTPNMILMANESGFNIEVVTTGIGLTKKIIDQISSIPFERFAISMQPFGSINRPGIKNEQKLWNIIEYAIEKLNNVHGDVVCTPEENNNLAYKKLKQFIERKKIHFRSDLHNRAGNLNQKLTINNTDFSTQTYCSRPLTNIVQPNGEISLCCMDWSLKHILGNLFTEKYVDIIKSEPMQNILKCLEKADLKNLLCRSCHYLEEVNSDWIPVSKRFY